VFARWLQARRFSPAEHEPAFNRSAGFFLSRLNLKKETDYEIVSRMAKVSWSVERNCVALAAKGVSSNN
jgi:hypothetical protein